MTWIDFLVIGLVVAFIASRFFGHKLPQDPRKPADRRMDWGRLKSVMSDGIAVRETGKTTKARESKKSRLSPPKPKAVDVSGLSGVALIQALDDGFSADKFRTTVTEMYRTFYKLWNKMDEVELARLCSPDMMDTLKKSLADYRKKGLKPMVSINNVDVEVGEARMNGRAAVVEAVITSTQTDDDVGVRERRKQPANALPHTVKVTWLLARAIGTDDPTWELQSITHMGAKA
jgi:predicted lipid-binding transport protein (Tim44 family)